MNIRCASWVNVLNGGIVTGTLEIGKDGEVYVYDGAQVKGNITVRAGGLLTAVDPEPSISIGAKQLVALDGGNVVGIIFNLNGGEIFVNKGATIGDNSIIYGSGTGYYVGEDAPAAFASDFTDGTNLFRLNSVQLTSDGSDYTYSADVPSFTPIVMTVGYGKLDSGASISVTGDIVNSTSQDEDLGTYFTQDGLNWTTSSLIHATDLKVSVQHATFEGFAVNDQSFGFWFPGINYDSTPPATPTPRPTSSPTPRPTQIPEPDLELSPTELLLVEGEAEAITANRAVTWASSDEAIATVDAAGLVTALKEGTALITATDSEDKTATCEVTVESDEKIFPGITVLAVRKGKTLTLPTFSGYQGDWSTGDSSIASVGKNGLNVTAHALGTTTLTYTVNSAPAAKKAFVLNDRKLKAGDKYIITLNVRKKGELVSKLTLDTKKLALSTVGKTTAKITGVAKPAKALDREVFYTSNKPEIATIDANGNITAISAGKTKIRVFSTNLKERSITVTVTGAITVKPAKKTLKVGKELTVKATVSEGLSDPTVTWVSSNPDVATVDALGRVVTLKKGKSTLTATASNGETASCVLTVKKK